MGYIYILTSPKGYEVNIGTNIGACARGKLKTAYGFKWSYNNVTE